MCLCGPGHHPLESKDAKIVQKYPLMGPKYLQNTLILDLDPQLEVKEGLRCVCAGWYISFMTRSLGQSPPFTFLNPRLG